MKVTVVGSSPAWPNPGGAHSGYLVEGGGTLLLDCGPGVLPRLREREGWPRVDAIVITHFHLDHWGDLVPWVWGAMYGPGRELPSPELWLQPGGAEMLEGFGEQLGFPDMFENAFTLRRYSDRETFATAGFQVTPVRVPHYDLETYALRVTNGEKTLAYSGDSAPAEELVEVARDADLFLCEATLAESREPAMRGHLSAEEALSAARAAGTRRLVVIHRPDELALDGDIERAHDGLELVL
jgi:ribonuclease BN (tRNA processing enzyme)